MTKLLDGFGTRPHEDLSILVDLVSFAVGHTGQIRGDETVKRITISQKYQCNINISYQSKEFYSE